MATSGVRKCSQTFTKKNAEKKTRSQMSTARVFFFYATQYVSKYGAGSHCRSTWPKSRQTSSLRPARCRRAASSRAAVAWSVSERPAALNGIADLAILSPSPTTVVYESRNPEVRVPRGGASRPVYTRIPRLCRNMTVAEKLPRLQSRSAARPVRESKMSVEPPPWALPQSLNLVDTLDSRNGRPKSCCDSPRV